MFKLNSIVLLHAFNIFIFNELSMKYKPIQQKDKTLKTDRSKILMNHIFCKINKEFLKSDFMVLASCWIINKLLCHCHTVKKSTKFCYLCWGIKIAQTISRSSNNFCLKLPIIFFHCFFEFVAVNFPTTCL